MYNSLNPSEIKPMRFEDKISHLVIYLEKWQSSRRDWEDTISYVLKHQDQANQFMLLDMLIERMANINITTFHSVFDVIPNDLEKAKSLRTFLLLIGTVLCYGNQSSTYYLERSFQTVLKQHGLMRKEIFAVDGVPTNKLPQELTDTLSRGITSIPQFISKCPNFFPQDALFSLLHWVAVYTVRNLDQLYHLDEFCKIVMGALYSSHKVTQDVDKVKVTTKVLILIFELCLKHYEGTENYFMVLEHIPDNILQKAISASKQEFEKFKQQHYSKLFAVLTQASLSPKTIKLILFLSDLLREQNEFITLRCIYDEFLLPRVIAGPLKLSTAVKEQLRELVVMYVEGLNEHITISSDQIREMVAQIADQESSFVDFWLRIAFIIVHPHAQLVKTLTECITYRGKNKMNDYLTEQDYQRIRSQSWPIIDKALDQKRLVLYKKCSIKGISQIGETHITCVLQLLFMSRHLPELLKQYEVDYTDANSQQLRGGPQVIRSKFLYELKQLFDRLKNPQAGCTIENVIANGPEAYIGGKGDKNCSVYIAHLFEKIVKELEKLVSPRRNDIITKFKGLFRSTVSGTVSCGKCRQKIDKIADFYIYTPPLGEFATEWASRSTFDCARCKHKNINEPMNNSIKLYADIFLVEMTRFFTKEGKTIKDLKQYPIPRRFKDHYLAGFISHVGTELAGSFLLHYRQEENLSKWYKFEGAEVSSFETNEDDEFEREFEQEHTPYLLVYQRYQRS